jgi:hypothetical protein
VRTRLGFDADERQRAVLDSPSRMGILNCSRQWGKSTVTAAKAVHRAWTTPGALVLVASHTERQSREFLRKSKEFARRLEVAPRGDGDNAISLLFPNGSRIVGLPDAEANVRGFSNVSLVLIDEAAYVSEGMYRALRPMLAISRGDLWMMSTPAGSSGFFWETWTAGGAEWHKICAPATECARMDAGFLAQERLEMGPLWFAQEYLCEFVQNGSQLFDRRALEAVMDDGPDPLEV